MRGNKRYENVSEMLAVVVRAARFPIFAATSSLGEEEGQGGFSEVWMCVIAAANSFTAGRRLVT